MNSYGKIVLTLIAGAVMGLLIMRLTEPKPVQAQVGIVIGLGVSQDGNSAWILRNGQPEHWGWNRDDEHLYRHDHEHR
jgi:hypothetical protein